MTKPSSNVKGVTYDKLNKRLQVEFVSGGIYTYDNVTPEMHGALVKSGSRGSWIASNLVRKPQAHPAKKVK